MKRKINSHKCKERSHFVQIHEIQEERKGHYIYVVDGFVKKWVDERMRSRSDPDEISYQRNMIRNMNLFIREI